MKKRSDGFFGLHFDFHADRNCTEIGRDVTEEMIRELIETLRPDYLQCDCKGVAGYSSYPTRAGNPAPGFIKDQLKIWRKITKEYDIPLVVHYSGLWDVRALELHPEWAVINEDGSRNKDIPSAFKGYADGLLIPQLAEVANDYQIDAVWIDCDCFTVTPDFDESVISAFEKESGLKLNKNGEGKYDKKQKEYREFLDFNRIQFFKYLGHYIDEVKKQTKNFEIAVNWAFSSFIPQPVCVDVDWLSGDFFTSSDSYHGARFEGRVLCEQNKPWDLMSWGFYYDFSPNCVFSVKSPDTLCREAAHVISLGGGFQIYNQQDRDGSVRLWEARELKSVARFMRDREPFLKGSKPFSNIGVLYSDCDMRNKYDGMFYFYHGGMGDIKGAVRIILDSARTCGILMDHTLTDEDLKEKDIIILPEIKYMNDEIKNTLLKFTENGGNIIISGHECCKLFEDVLDGVIISEECNARAISVPYKSRYINQYAKISDTVNGNNEAYITKTKYGKGNIIAIYYNIFEIYYHTPDFYVRNMISEIIDGLDTDKFLEYKGQKFVDIITSRKDGKLMINLTNTSGIYSEVKLRAYDEIQPLADIEISVKTEKEPKSVVLQPENIIPGYSYDPETRKLTVKIDSLHIHSVIVIE